MKYFIGANPMRFSASILLDGGKMVIPSDYRRNILSLIKEAINPGQSGTEIYEKYYVKEARKIKPFTFSVNFKTDDTNSEKGRLHLSEPKLNLFFSASDPVFLIYVYNGLVQLKKDYPLFPGLKAKMGRFNLEQQKNFQLSESVFKTCSPVLVRDTDASGKSRGYITADRPEFGDRLYHSVKSMCKALLDDASELKNNDFAAEWIRSQTVRINHYQNKDAAPDSKKEMIEATSGTIKIKAPANVLQLIYDAGLGAKRSQGFGMLEIL
jgi:CRISPR-associated endoribonuclease Cas6